MCMAAPVSASSIIDQEYVIGADGRLTSTLPNFEGLIVTSDYFGDLSGVRTSVLQTFTVGVSGALTGAAVQLGNYFGTAGIINVDVFGAVAARRKSKMKVPLMAFVITIIRRATCFGFFSSEDRSSVSGPSWNPFRADGHFGLDSMNPRHQEQYRAKRD